MTGRTFAFLSLTALLGGALGMPGAALAQCRLCRTPTTEVAGEVASGPVRIEVQARLDFDQLVVMDAALPCMVRLLPDGTASTSGAIGAISGRAMVGSVIVQSMILYAPRRVTIAPNEPQTIRISARAPQGLADGEYRAHLLFRAVPPPRPVTAPREVKGIAFELIPIYGVTIPVVIRMGNLQAKVGIANVQLTRQDGKPAVALDLTRAGDRSVFGDVRVFKAGIKEPIAIQRGVAVYTEVGTRHVVIPVNPDLAGAASGPVTVDFVETSEAGPVSMAETKTVLR